MDPLSITASALGIAANVLKTALFLKEVVDQLKDAPSFARDIADEITTTQAALSQVEAALAHDPQAIRRFRLDDIFDLSVNGCLETLQHIDEEFEAFFGREDWRAPLGVWWNAGDIRRYLGRLEAKKGSLMLLVQALSLRSVQEMQDLVRQNQATLDIARLGLEDMIPSYPAYTEKDLDSFFSQIGFDSSVLGDRDSTISHTRFPFDNICFNSRAYRRAVTKKRAHQLPSKTSVPGLQNRLPGVAEQNAETKSQSSNRTAAPNLPTAIYQAVHEATCLKLKEAEARIRYLEEQMEFNISIRFRALQQQQFLMAFRETMRTPRHSSIHGAQVPNETSSTPPGSFPDESLPSAGSNKTVTKPGNSSRMYAEETAAGSWERERGRTRAILRAAEEMAAQKHTGWLA
ncbi:hypothetical protein GE09DRAFT_300192 [Coniochaeta sp. 2T2.1]|nr:hypothetical protein GE09DRAFT_300192 [Coniochaeta sp. 2T2.1]